MMNIILIQGTGIKILKVCTFVEVADAQHGGLCGRGPPPYVDIMGTNTSF